MQNEEEKKDPVELVPEIKFTDIDQLSQDQLVKLAEENYELMNYDKCYILYEEALKRNPQNEEALCSYGYFLANVKDKEKAKKLLLDAVLLNPEKNHKKYLHLAELFECEESAQLYIKSIQIMTNLINSTQNNLFASVLTPKEGEIDMSDTTKDLSQAYSALGELYMTDLARIPNAVNICKEYLLKSIEVDENNLDGYLQLGNYFLEVDDPETAEAYMNKFIEKYKILSEKDDFQNDYSDEMLLHAVRTLIDMQAYGNALVILEDLVEDDDGNIEVLYLLAYCNYMLKNYLTTEEYLEELNKKDLSKDGEIKVAKEELEAEMKKVDVSKGNDYEEIKEECISNNSMEVE